MPDSSLPMTDASKPQGTNPLDNNTLGFAEKAAENLDEQNGETDVLKQFLDGFKSEWDNYTAYLDSENSKIRKWLEEMADRSFNREINAQETAYQREFNSMKNAGLNPYAYFLNGGNATFSTPSHNVNASAFATASRPQGLENAVNLFLKRLETFSATAYRSDMTDLQKEQLKLQEQKLIMDFVSVLSSSFNQAHASLSKS